MEKLTFSLNGSEYIELTSLLKYMGLANGAQAQSLVSEGRVLRAGAVELRKRAKLRIGDCITVGEVMVEVVA